MKRIILDTNFLISLFKFRVDLEIERIVYEPYKLVTVKPVINELEKIASSKGKDSKNAKLALKFIKTKNIEILNTSEKNTDNAIIALANKNTIVATNDIKLRKKLKKLEIKTIYLRAKKHLAMG
jgi:rRNA-processing protein FCF1